MVEEVISRICSLKKTDERHVINHQLLKHARPFMKELFSLADEPVFVLFTDSEGCIIEVIKNMNSMKLESVLSYIIGDKIDDKYISPTIYNKPNEVYYTDHDGREINISFITTPVNLGDKVIGTITIICEPEHMNIHTLPMAMAASKAISAMVEMENNKNELLYRNQCNNAIVNSITDGLLIVDKDGYLTYINQIGIEMLGLKHKNPIGKHVTELVDFKPVILEVLETGKGYVDKDIIVTTSLGEKIRFIKTAIPIRDDEGNLIGVVDSFKKIKTVKNFVNNFMGSYANYCFDDIIGSSKNLAECIRLAKIASNSTSNVLIYGESGTGKEIIAHSIHNASSRRDKPFISVNCGAIPRELLESELFGYEPGAFTGASKKGRVGKFELADGGTLFLDEIGDMPLDMQVKLLRVIQERKITRIGGNITFDIDVRLITATNKNLLKYSELGQFRKDLYYRINVLNINLPPLRDRKSDIDELVPFFINKLSSKLDKRVIGITEEALKILKQYNWPGNIRELENIIERAINISNGEFITKYELPREILDCGKIQDDDMKNDYFKIEPLDIIEKRVIEKALHITSGNISNAANLLNITRNTVYNKMKKYNIEYK